MPQVNVWTYVEIDTGSSIIPIGSRVDPMSLVITSDLALHHGIFADLSASIKIYDYASAGAQFLDGFAFVATEDGVLTFKGTNVTDTSSQDYAANTVLVRMSGQTTVYNATGPQERGEDTLQDITEIWFYPTTTPANCEIVGWADSV